MLLVKQSKNPQRQRIMDQNLTEKQQTQQEQPQQCDTALE